MPPLLRDIAREVAANAAMTVPLVRRWRLKRPRAEGDPLQPLQGVERLTGPVAGKDVIEFGPGDNLSSGLAFLAAGAKSYTALDRFVPDYSSPSAKHSYRLMHDEWGAKWPDDLDPDHFPEAYPDRVRALSESIETAHISDQFDVVTSWQVGEHVLDIKAFCHLTASLLKPGGVAVHRVDFGPHNWDGYPDPLTFLRFPPALWAAMAPHEGFRIGTAITNSCPPGRRQA